MLASLCLLAASFGGSPAAPATRPVKSAGWLVFYDGGPSMADFRANWRSLDSVSAEWLLCKSDGTVDYVKDSTPALRSEAVSLAHSHHLPILGMLQNPGFDPSSVEKILSDSASSHAHVMNLVNAVIADRLDGLDLDYESLKAGDRDRFSSFVEDLAAQLHARKKQLAIALHAKTSEPGDWDGPQAQDYRRIGAAVDWARVMCYDEHWETSDAGPVAGIDWVTRVMGFAATQIPASKLDIGVPGYGYNWLGKKGSDLTYTEFMALPGAMAAQRDPVSQELSLPNGEKMAWFCDAKAEQPKIDLARSLGLHGVCLWRIGSEDPAYWGLFKP